MYNTIKSPLDNKKYNINSNEAKQILIKYLEQLGGGRWKHSRQHCYRKTNL